MKVVYFGLDLLNVVRGVLGEIRSIHFKFHGNQLSLCEERIVVLQAN